MSSYITFPWTINRWEGGCFNVSLHGFNDFLALRTQTNSVFSVASSPAEADISLIFIRNGSLILAWQLATESQPSTTDDSLVFTRNVGFWLAQHSNQLQRASTADVTLVFTRNGSLWLAQHSNQLKGARTEHFSLVLTRNGISWLVPCRSSLVHCHQTKLWLPSCLVFSFMREPCKRYCSGSNSANDSPSPNIGGRG